MSDDELEQRRVAAHESAHTVAAWRLRGRISGPVSIAPAKRWLGVAFVAARHADLTGVDVGQPLAMWPAQARRYLETEILICLAGAAGEELAQSPRSREGGYRRDFSIPPSPPSPLELAPLTALEEQQLASGNSDEPAIPNDLERAHELAVMLAGDQAEILLQFMWGQVRDQVRGAWRRPILRLADELEQHETLSSRAVRALLASNQETTRRGVDASVCSFVSAERRC